MPIKWVEFYKVVFFLFINIGKDDEYLYPHKMCIKIIEECCIRVCQF